MTNKTPRGMRYRFDPEPERYKVGDTLDAHHYEWDNGAGYSVWISSSLVVSAVDDAGKVTGTRAVEVRKP